MRKRVIIDCDTGIDDAVALALALWSDKLDVLGITTVAGNVELEYTFPNTLRVVGYMGKDLPITRGCDRPLVRPLRTAAHVHGKDGLPCPSVPSEPSIKGDPRHSVDWMRDTLMKSDEKVTLIPVGPLTNIAMLLLLYPEVSGKIERITLMGGARVSGNQTPSMEFNIGVDPEAARVVFRSGIPLVMCGLDVTMKAYVTDAENAELAKLGTTASVIADEGHVHYTKRFSGRDFTPQHDSCAVAYEIDESMFETVDCNIDVETSSDLCDGFTLVDARADGKPKFHKCVVGVDRARFVDLLHAAIASYPKV